MLDVFITFLQTYTLLIALLILSMYILKYEI